MATYNNDRENLPRKVVAVMPRSNPGRKVVREYVPPHLREALAVCRLANAEWHSKGSLRMRYVLVCNIHEGIDPEQPLQILDSLAEEHNRMSGKSQFPEYLYVADLMSRLSEDARKSVLYS